jgi:hypothetical protein
MAKNIHHSVPGQLSSHINKEYPQFVEFLKSYYEWLESDASPYSDLKNHLSYLDFKDSIGAYTDFLKKEYLESVPEKVLADKELLIRYSKQFWQSIGTEKSFQFIFKILYGEEVEIYYPRDDILRASDGKWVENESLMYISNNGDVDSFLYRRIEQVREVFPGIFEYAYATVGRIIRRYSNKFNFAEIYLTDVEGEFDLDYPIGIDGVYEWILPIAKEANIISAGTNYIPDNIFEYNGVSTFDINIVAELEGSVDARYTTVFEAAELYVELDGIQITDFSYNGKLIVHPNIVPGSQVLVRYPVYSGFVTVGTTNGVGDVTSINIIDTPFGIVSEQQMVGSYGGTGAVIELVPGLLRSIPGYFFNTDGFLSDGKYLQDNYYYQDFSYVIKAGIDIERYRDVVLDVLHPAGMNLLGEVNILELIQLMIREVNLSISVQDVATVSFKSEVDLYNRYGFIDDWKYKLGTQTYKMGNFADIVVGDVVLNYMRQFNIHDSKIYTYEPYVELGYFDDGYTQDNVYE